MKSISIVSIFMAVMILIGSFMTPIDTNENGLENEVSIIEVENG